MFNNTMINVFLMIEITVDFNIHLLKKKVAISQIIFEITRVNNFLGK